MMTAFRESLLQAGLDVSVAILEYSACFHPHQSTLRSRGIPATAPQAAYPTQFRQAVAALAHLTARGRAPSSIAVLGDSAGAHIALCAAAHVLHPHPAVPALAPAGALAGLCCLSPRTSNATDAPSCAANTRRDTLERATFRRWIDAFRAGSALAGAAGAAADGAYTAPVDAPAEWWTGFGGRVARRVFVSAGAHECLRDYQVAFAEQMRAVPGVDVTLVVEPRGIHDSPLMDIGSGRPKTDLIRAVEAWLAQTFGA
jgi:acetyl esterase/lipase